MTGRRLALLYALFFLGGTASLVYEVMWMRSFSLVFGSTTRAAAAVLAAFFAGLACGGLLGARLARRRASALLETYAIAELVVGIGALLVGPCLAGFRLAYPSLYQFTGGSGVMLTALKVALSFFAMAIPCIAMGVTLPLVTQVVVDRTAHLGRRTGSAYALNTLGGVTGVLLAGFVLPPTIGTTNSIYLAVGINLVIATGALWLARDGRRRPATTGTERGTAASSAHAPAPGAATSRTPGRSDALVLFVVAASGFGTLALEVLYTRLIVNIMDSSVFSFAAMLATFLLFLALASLLVSATVDRSANPWRLLAWTQSLAVVAILLSPSFFRVSAGDGARTLASYLVALLAQLTLVMGPTVLLVGVALPTAWKIAAREAAESGFRVGRLTGLNTLGSVLGSVITGFVLLPALGIPQSVMLVALLYAVIAIASSFRAYGARRALLAGMLVLLAASGLVSKRTMASFIVLLGPDQTLVDLQVGESVNLAIIDDADGVRQMKVNNGYVLGRTDELAVAMQRGQAGLPLLLHPDAESVAFLGIGTAVSVSPVLDFPVKRVLALELLPEVVAATPFLESANLGVLDDPRVETLVVDGRNHLFATDERFDLIVADLFAPWQAGTGYLYTREHFASVARRLKEGGLFTQWLPAHQLSVEELRIIVATFLDVFPEAELWRNRPDVRALGSLALVASAGAPPPLERRVAASVSRAFTGLQNLCAPGELRTWAEGAERNTDRFPRIEFSAAVTRFDRAEHMEQMRETLSSLCSGLRG